MNISKKFIKLKLFQKIEIYLMVIMFYGVIIYYIDNIYPNKPIIIKKYIKNNNILQQKLPNIKKLNINEIIAFIDKKATILNISISKIDINNKIFIQFSGKFIDILNLLNYIKKHFEIFDIKLQKSNNGIEVKIDINLKYIFNLGMLDNNYSNIPSPFGNIKTNIISNGVEKKPYLKDIKVKKLKLIAIISDEVNINNIWYKNNDFINKNQKIVIIDKNTIILKNIITKKSKILNIYQDIPLSK